MILAQQDKTDKVRGILQRYGIDEALLDGPITVKGFEFRDELILPRNLHAAQYRLGGLAMKLRHEPAEQEGHLTVTLIGFSETTPKGLRLASRSDLALAEGMGR